MSGTAKPLNALLFPSILASRLFGAGVRLHQAENISRWILRVGQPTHFRNRHLRHANASAEFLDFPDRLIQRRDGNRVDRAGTLTFSRTQEPAINSRILVIARRHQPIFNRTALELLELPSENVPVKRLHRFRIVRVNLEMNDTLHNTNFGTHGPVARVFRTLNCESEFCYSPRTRKESRSSSKAAVL